MKNIFPKEIIENTIEVHRFKHTVRSKIIYSIVLLSVIGIAYALPYFSIDIYSSARGILKSEKERNQITSLYSGRIESIHIKENQYVQKGDTLLTINNAIGKEKVLLLSNQLEHSDLLIHDLKYLSNTKNVRQDSLSSFLYQKEYIQYAQKLRELQTRRKKIKYSSKSYEFTIYDGSESYTMNQFNKNYLSSYRIFSRTLDELIPNKKISSGIKFISIALFGLPFTHEEGHRSVLTSKGIGSVSQPFFNSKGAAYVKGVRDMELINLRNNDLPYYIRLHTAGLESDYMIATKIEELVVFEEESYAILKEEYLLRKLALMNYHLTSLIPALSPDLTEESDELKRDIVGHDIWGMGRHLHRPNMTFNRYTQFDDLTTTEKKYARNLAWKSYTNLLSPMLFGKSSFNLNTNLKGNFSIGHTLSPFGDYFEQNFFLYYKNKYKVVFYLREFMNQNNTFLASGIKLHNYRLSNKIHASFGLDFWSQPENLSFTTNKSKLGGNVYLKINVLAFKSTTNFIKGIGIFSEVFYKSDGFLPEYTSLESDFGLRFGLSFSY